MAKALPIASGCSMSGNSTTDPALRPQRCSAATPNDHQVDTLGRVGLRHNQTIRSASTIASTSSRK
jgi:hypothetical protein